MTVRPHNAPPQRYMKFREGAKYLGMDTETLRAHAVKGEVPAFKIGNAWYIDLYDLDMFISRKRLKPRGTSR